MFRESAKRLHLRYIGLFALGLLFSLSLRAENSNHISGDGVKQDWHISINGSEGTFTVEDRTWILEYFQTTPGLNEYARMLSFLGREDDNFTRVDIFLDFIGEDFIVYYYDYKNGTLEFDNFKGSYSVNELSERPDFMEGYLPKGKVPDYDGQDFVLKTEFADVTSAAGTVSYKGLNLKVFPVYNVVISPTWSEFWTIGIAPDTGHTYFLIFYRTQSAWLVDLWSGEVRVLPLGEAEVLSDDVLIKRDFLLEDHAQ